MIKRVSRFLPVLLSVSAGALMLNAELQKSTNTVLSPTETGKIKSVGAKKAPQRLNMQTRNRAASPFRHSMKGLPWKGKAYSGAFNMTGDRAEAQFDVPTIYGCIVYKAMIDKGSVFG